MSLTHSFILLDGFPAYIEQYGFQDNMNEVGIVRSEGTFV